MGEETLGKPNWGMARSRHRGARPNHSECKSASMSPECLGRYAEIPSGSFRNKVNRGFGSLRRRSIARRVAGILGALAHMLNVLGDERRR